MLASEMFGGAWLGVRRSVCVGARGSGEATHGRGCLDSKTGGEDSRVLDASGESPASLRSVRAGEAQVMKAPWKLADG